ncbi:MAG: hypothetical protein JWN25_1689 [Verrucomicrobiales bacterium]|nr:hypothetical protein [Verrucomicrobiales bacterium]
MKWRSKLIGLSAFLASIVLLADSIPLMITSTKDLDNLALDDKSATLQTKLLRRITGKVTNSWIEISLHFNGDVTTNAPRSGLLLLETQRIINGFDGFRTNLQQKFPTNEEIVVSFQEGEVHPLMTFKNGALNEISLLMGTNKVALSTNDITSISLFLKKSLVQARQ